MAFGIPSMDVIPAQYDGWQDPEFVMDKGMQGVAAAKHLEENFREVVKSSSKILEKKCFLLVLDDIDIDFRKGWPVLEVVRKYLTSSSIITLISGDLQLNRVVA